MPTIEQIDQNFLIHTACTRERVAAYDVLQPPFSLHGVFYAEGKFRRLPEEVARAANEGVLALHGHCAGGRVRFVTDSPYIAVQARLGDIGKMSHFALTGSAGFDLYSSCAHVATFQPRFDITETLFGSVTLPQGQLREYTLNLPLYSEVRDIRILLDEGAVLLPAGPFDQPPVVFYGSSITQGGCASRPGTAYPAVLCRKLGLDHINLGFSGSARGEQAVREWLAGLDMCAFVLDYDHNAPSARHLRETYGPLFRAVRQTHPHIPILCVTRPIDVAPDQEERHRIILETVEQARAAGDEQVCFVDMRAQLLQHGLLEEASVDGSHPNDLGFFAMSQVLEPILRRALGLR